MRWMGLAVVAFAVISHGAAAQSARSRIESDINDSEMQFQIDQLRQQMDELKRQVQEDREQRQEQDLMAPMPVAPQQPMSPEMYRALGLLPKP